MPKHGSVSLYVHRNRKAQDGHLDFHTAPELAAMMMMVMMMYSFMSSDVG